ncbi:hypothetical protein MMC08_006252 [Hypocenomyce scalaris]|nr:hypothetical protein [Hypocenomyce scalaris]
MNDIYESSALVPAHQDSVLLTSFNDHSETFPSRSTRRTRRFRGLDLLRSCACDVPAHNYTYSFEPKPDWSTVYGSASEISQYFSDFASKYTLEKYIKTLHQVNGAQWIESECKWSIKIKNLSSGEAIVDSCDVLINAGGYLNEWRWPKIPGLHNYKGKLLHSANWDDTVSLEGKNIGLIGNGSSGVQILPAVQPSAGTLTAFIRSPNWIISTVGTEQRAYTETEIKNFTYKPKALTALRKANEAVLNSYFTLYLQDSPLQAAIAATCATKMKQELKGDILTEKLIPTWGVGCRRLTPGPGYLESLSKDNVSVIYGEVLELTEQGCKCDDGKEYFLDILICATGFDTSYKPRFPVLGHGGKNMQDTWAEEPKSYLGIAAPEFPNMFMFLGPNSPIGNGPVLPAIGK